MREDFSNKRNKRNKKNKKGYTYSSGREKLPIIKIQMRNKI